MRNIRLFTFRVLIAVLGALLLGTTLSLAQVNVSLPAVNAQVGQALSLPITVGTLPTGVGGVLSYQFTVTYDKAVITITGVDIAGSLTASSANLVTNADTATGSIRVSWAGTTALSGSGTLIKLGGSVKTAGSTAVIFSSFFFNEGSPAANLTNGSVTVPALSLRLPTSSARVGQSLSIGLASDNLTGKGVKSYQFTVSYNPAVVKLTGYSVAGSLTPSSYSISVNPDTVNGRLILSAAGTTDLSGVGDLIYLTGRAVTAGSSSLTFSNLFYNENTPAVGGIDGAVTVTANTKPTFAAVTAKTGNEKDTLRFTVLATDPENDPLTYSASGLPTGATFTASTQTFFWVPDTNQAGSYNVKFFVSDGILSDSITVSITVKNILVVLNPITDKTLPDGARLSKQKLTGTARVFGGNVGALTFTASSANTTYVEASIVGGDTLQVRGKIATPTGSPVTVTLTARDAENTTLSTTFRVTVTGITDVEPGPVVPVDFALAQNYPNPFNPSTTIRFSLPKEAPVTLEIYNVLGVKVRTLIAGQTMGAAFHSVVWDGKDDVGVTVPSGVYLYRIHADQFTAAKKMTVLK